MRVLLLDQLRPGDIILETGDPRIAAAAGMSFTHAAIALGRLVKIEAGKECGVVLNPFDFVSYRDGTRRFAGVPFDAGESVRVLRRKAPLDEGTMRGEAIWEAGRAYSVPKLLELPDLPESLRKRLQRKFERMPAPDTADVREGRFCPEVAAKILQLRETIVSPDGLASASELEAVGAAVAEIDPNRLEVVRPPKRQLAICSKTHASDWLRQRCPRRRVRFGEFSLLGRQTPWPRKRKHSNLLSTVQSETRSSFSMR